MAPFDSPPGATRRPRPTGLVALAVATLLGGAAAGIGLAQPPAAQPVPPPVAGLPPGTTPPAGILVPGSLPPGTTPTRPAGPLGSPTPPPAPRPAGPYAGPLANPLLSGAPPGLTATPVPTPASRE